MHQTFQRGLKKHRCDWPVSIFASSLDVVVRYVENSYGVGVGLDLPELLPLRTVRALPLTGFDPIKVVAFWRKRPSELVQATLDEARVIADEFEPSLHTKTARG